MTAVIILETAMLICFALSWPASLYKSIKSRTAKGKSVVFLIFVQIGYLAGISKVALNDGWTGFLLIPYTINFLLVFADFLFYLRNTKLDKAREAA